MDDLLNPPQQAQGASIDAEVIDSILEEIAGFEVPLAEDPTLPELGTPYLQRTLARCRAYLNRVQYYLQMLKRFEKRLKLDLKQRELDLEFKLKEKLADDGLVRQQPSIEDRKALAATMLKEEHESVAKMRVELTNLEESIKLIKMAYDHLNRTNGDIKLQRHLVRDDKFTQLGGDEGYTRPQARQDGTMSNGMAPVVTPAPIEAKDLMDPEKRPEDMPEPVNAAHAKQIADFFSGKTLGKAAKPESKDPDSGDNSLASDVVGISYDDLLG